LAAVCQIGTESWPILHEQTAVIRQEKIVVTIAVGTGPRKSILDAQSAFAAFLVFGCPNTSSFVRRELTPMVLYAFSLGWFLLAPRKWFPEEEYDAESTSVSLIDFGRTALSESRTS
jgi:hypothetical protein